MKHLLRDMDMIVPKKEKLQLVIQFAGSGSLKAEIVQFWLEGQQLKSLKTPEKSEHFSGKGYFVAFQPHTIN